VVIQDLDPPDVFAPEKPPSLADEVFALAILYLNVRDHFDA
jgi:hypothetical protein